MKWQEIINRDEFISLCEKICINDQARYSLIYGMALDMDKFGSNLMLKFGEEAIAFQTNATKAMVITDLKQPSAAALGLWLESNKAVKEIVGSKDTINLILDHMRSTNPGYPELIMDQRVYRIDKVKFNTETKNKLIKAEEVHKKIVKDWFEQFLIDAFIDTNPSKEKIEALATSRLENDEVYLLIKDGNPVSMACSSRPTKDAITVNGVFTPIEHRANGLASETVARLSSKLLTDYKYCSLYTDLSNPTSNKIYQRVGYYTVCDSLHYKLRE
jgi:predicted GNAT family acetyltransferase